MPNILLYSNSHIPSTRNRWQIQVALAELIRRVVFTPKTVRLVAFPNSHNAEEGSQPGWIDLSTGLDLGLAELVA